MKRASSSATTLRRVGLSTGLILGFLANPVSAFYVEDEEELDAILKRSNPSAEDVLEAVGTDIEDDKIKLLLEGAHGKDITGHTDDDGESSDAATW